MSLPNLIGVESVEDFARRAILGSALEQVQFVLLALKMLAKLILTCRLKFTNFANEIVWLNGGFLLEDFRNLFMVAKSIFLIQSSPRTASEARALVHSVRTQVLATGATALVTDTQVSFLNSPVLKVSSRRSFYRSTGNPVFF